MELKTLCIKNYRRLKDVKIDISKETTIFVGANNSGKTSATHIFQAFLGGKADFSLYDFSADCWKKIEEISKSGNINEDIKSLPTISLDLWFTVSEDDLNYIIDLLPCLDWTEQPVGIRLEYAPKLTDILLVNYLNALKDATTRQKDDFHPWPKNLSDYLTKRLNQEYDTSYYVLDANEFDDNFQVKNEGYIPHNLQEDKESKRTGATIVKSLIKVDFLNAQRFLSDSNSTGRSEDLSKRFNRFYERNLEKRENDPEIYKALFDSEALLTSHLEEVFKPTLRSLNQLGYPGFSNPKLLIKASYNQESVSQYAQLHYSLGELNLPDKYNGLGFKNLIYMVIEVLDFHERWIEDKDVQAPLHLILIEEPEAHLHAQLQQVFIRQILNIIKNTGKDNDKKTQLIVSTHSPHIIYESGFKPIRYFRRHPENANSPVSEVMNLSYFYNKSEKDSREFLEKYMKLTHCDLFFADAAILVEGNVERLLLPLMIEKCQKRLQSNYLSIIEVGGAFAYLFKELLEFLGLTTLVITDLDSVLPAKPGKKKGSTEDKEEEDEEDGSACSAMTPEALTSNQTLLTWLPKKSKVAELIACSEKDRTQDRSTSNATIQVCFQNKVTVVWGNTGYEHIGRTLEETFALENLMWTQEEENKKLGLRVVIKVRELSIEEILERIYKRIQTSNFDKTNFALWLLMADSEKWVVPSYIEKGLAWLDKVLNPPISTVIIPPNGIQVVLQPAFAANQEDQQLLSS